MVNDILAAIDIVLLILLGYAELAARAPELPWHD